MLVGALRPLPRVWPVHQGDLSCNLAPLELPLDNASAVVPTLFAHLLRLQELLPFQKLVGKPEVRLDDDVESASAHEAVSSWEGKVEGPHHLGNADSCAAGYTDPTVD
jgi:hypothetical protein